MVSGKDNTSQFKKLNLDFYLRENVRLIAKNLLGKILFTHFDGKTTAGRIVESEAYCGRGDAACHSNNGRRTPRTEVMYQNGGVGYIYICYGIHHLFNVVTNKEGCADAVLIRAIEPIFGLETMQKRRGSVAKLAAGPGILSEALGINIQMNGVSLIQNKIWIAEEMNVPSFEIEVTTRIGVESAGVAAKYPWRFIIKNNKYVSR